MGLIGEFFQDFFKPAPEPSKSQAQQDGITSDPFLNPSNYGYEVARAINKDNQEFNTNSATIAYLRQKSLDELSRQWSHNENVDARTWQETQNALNREWQTTANQAAMDFEKSERLAKQEYDAEMSNTAIQRQVADLKKAGLNPILAATTLGGASSPAAATGSGYANGAGTSGVSPISSSRSSVNSARSNSLSASSIYHIGDLAKAVSNTAAAIARIK